MKFIEFTIGNIKENQKNNNLLIFLICRKISKINKVIKDKKCCFLKINVVIYGCKDNKYEKEVNSLVYKTYERNILRRR